MATVFIPQLLQEATGGVRKVGATGTTLREVIADLVRQHPGLGEKIIDGGGIRPEVLVAIDSDEAFNADQPVGPNAEVHILPAIAGG